MHLQVLIFAVFNQEKLYFKDKINKRGNKHLRKLLFLIIQNMIKQRRFGQNHIRRVLR